MKKFTVLALALLLVVAFTVPASAALENIFGGYWRTRMVQQRNFDGDDAQAQEESKDNVLVDTRTRLYYTAKLNDNLKLVNEFEMNTKWGDPTAYGRSGTDVRDIMVRITYADFKVGPVNFMVGAQLYTLGRGFISDDTGIGMKAIYKVNDGLYFPFIWNKSYEGNLTVGEDKTRDDVDLYVIAPIIMLSKDIKINPYYVFAHGQNAYAFGTNQYSGYSPNVGSFSATTGLPIVTAGQNPLCDNLNVHMLGLDFDGKFGPASLWFTGILQRGDITVGPNLGLTANPAVAGLSPGDTVKVRGYLAALGGKFDLGKADIHGQVFIASGDDDGLADKKAKAYLSVAAQSYYWSEIMGLGTFDQQASAGSPADKVSNVIAANLGTTIKPMDKLTVSADLWWAKLKEENASGEKKLGLEADLKITYQLVEGLNLDIVGAYLFAGDATSSDGKNEKDPYEFGTRLSLSF